MMHLSTRNNGRLIGIIIAICVAILLYIWTNYVQQKQADKADTVATAIERNSNLAVALEQYTIRTLHNAETVLQLVQMEYEREGNRIDIDHLLFTNAVNNEVFRAVSIIDTNGRLLKINLAHQPDSVIDFSDRDYFQYHRHNEDGRLFIAPPRQSRTLNKTVISISMRMNDSKGRFAGVVSTQLEPSAFTLFYAQANLHTHDIISLIAPDGTTYARRTGAIESSGENIIKSPLFKNVAKNPDSFYLARDAIRGIPTWFSYRRFKDYPIIATVGTSEQDVLSSYYKRSRRDLVSAIVISMLVLLFSISVSLVLVNRKRAAEASLREEQRYQQQLTEQVIAAQEREREGIGRELHDNVNQVLTTVKLYLEMAIHKEEVRVDFIKKSIGLILSTIEEIRHLSRELSAPTLGTRSLVDSIQALVEMISSAGRLRIDFEHSGYTRPVSMKQKLAIYRIVQEQVNNIIKHAGATEAAISLSQTETDTLLRISDNGKGFNTSNKRNGIGLNNITSRAKIFNGTVSIRSQPQKGCLLQVSLPFLEEAANENI